MPPGSSICSHPSPKGKPASSKKPPAPAWAKPIRGTVGVLALSGRADPACAFTSATNSSKEEPVASMIFERDSVDGQRGRPSAEQRLDLLKAVESSPALRARPDGERQ